MLQKTGVNIWNQQRMKEVNMVENTWKQVVFGPGWRLVELGLRVQVPEDA